MPTSIQVTFDCADPHALCAWWAERLNYEVGDVHELVGQLLANGTITDADVTTVDGRRAFASATAASDPAGRGPRMYFQRVPEPKTAKNRLHLDIQTRADDLQALVDEYVAAGATYVTSDRQPGHDWAVMRDPEGNEFCLS